MKKLIFYLLLLFFMASFLFSAVINVPADYNTIQGALNAAQSGDTILVAPGIYYENIVWPMVDSLKLISSGGKENTIIDGSNQGRVIGIICDWQGPFISRSTVIDGFTIRRGYLSVGNGPAICLNFASPVLKNLNIHHNYTEVNNIGDGGGIYAYQSSPIIKNCIIYNNKAYAGGGIFLFAYSSAIIDSCIISDNELTSPGGSFGSGIYAYYQSNYNMTNSVICRNSTYGQAAIDIDFDINPTIIYNTICENKIGIFLRRNAFPSAVTNNYFYMNENYGVWNNNTNSTMINMPNNWWGASSGPLDAIHNPNGTGDEIYGYINPIPFYENPDNVNIINCPLIPPTGVIAENITNNSVKINWDLSPLPFITGFKVYYGTDSLKIYQDNVVDVGNNFTKTLTGLLPNTDYYINVSCYDGNLRESWLSKRIKIHTLSGTAINHLNKNLINTFNYPNPFNPETIIKFELANNSNVKIEIFDINGKLIKNLIEKNYNKGNYSVIWDGKNEKLENVGSGVYFYKITSDNFSVTQKMLLLK